MAELDQFDRLLGALPQIAESLNLFTSEDVQKAAFSALIAALHLQAVQFGTTAGNATADLTVPDGDGHARTQGSGQETDPAATTASDKVKVSAKPSRSRGSRKAGATVTPVRDINFWPTDQATLPEFVAEKAPTNNNERNLVVVYYLEQRLGRTEISAAEVLAAYKACSWPEPNAPVNALQVTASAKHWIDTKDSKAIKTTPGGRNMVEHTMPVAKKSKGSASS